MARRHTKEELRLAIQSVMRGLPATERELLRSRTRAEREFRELIDLAPGPRRNKIARANKRFRDPILVDLFLDAAQEEAGTDPAAARELAECAHEVALRLPEGALGGAGLYTYVARANAHRGNTLRILGDLIAAEPLLESASALFFEQGNADPLVGGEILRLMASLRYAQRRFVEAKECLEQALDLYHRCQERILEARTRIKLAMVLSEIDETQAAIRSVQLALRFVRAESEPRLFLAAQHNLTVYLEDLGRYDEAWELLMAHRELYEASPDRWTRLRFSWSVGTISRGLGRLAEAESALLEVQREFLDGGLGYDAALAGLDLALVYVSLRQPGKLRALARQMVPVFLSQDIHREALTALLLFQEAARQDAVTAEMVRGLVKFLKEMRRKPPEPIS